MSSVCPCGKNSCSESYRCLIVWSSRGYVELPGWLCVSSRQCQCWPDSVQTSSCVLLVLLCYIVVLQSKVAGWIWESRTRYNAADIHTLAYSRGDPNEAVWVQTAGESGPSRIIISWMWLSSYRCERHALATFTLRALLNLDLLPSTRSRGLKWPQIKRFFPLTVWTQKSSPLEFGFESLSHYKRCSVCIYCEDHVIRLKTALIPPRKVWTQNTVFLYHIRFTSPAFTLQAWFRFKLGSYL